MKKRVVLLLSAFLIVCHRREPVRAPAPARAPAPEPSYRQARELLDRNEPKEAAKALAPYLAPGNPFRDLALYHQAEIDDALGRHDAASADRQALIIGYPSAFYRAQAIDDEVEYLMRDPRRLAAFAQRIPSRDVQARLAEASGNAALALAILAGGTTDDAAEHAARVLDHVPRLTPPQKILLGTTMLNHRHFDRAVALLSSVPHGDNVTFDIGRAYFGDEKFAKAQATYLRGAQQTKNAAMKTTFLWHAARAAQLQGNDGLAERLMTQAIAQPARTAATAAALTQRLRTRLKQRRFAEAAADLGAVRKLFPKDHAVVEASLAYAVGMLGAGNPGACVVTINAIPRNLVDKLELYELEYWRARALESLNPSAARSAYLDVANAPVPTHFAYFARQRLHFQPDLAKLAASYRAKPAYAAVLGLKPLPFPRFPLPPGASRAEVLMAMGLFDEATDDIPRIWPLHPMRSGLTQSLALNRGNAGHESIHAIEEVMKSVPADYVPQLLPRLMRELLYPRFFDREIKAESAGADPTLVLAIMREESRFNPRAKSAAAARGLLQLIITTARKIDGSVDEDDLYDPPVIIRLGAKYIATLSKRFGGDNYKIAAAYNAGPYQTALWSRLATGPGDDFFLTAVSFDETKDYVRKVMNSYENYEELRTKN
ncbi:MAG TPA: lytic transglycosylase domain-containing protein [Thermoanaerobaculia bacterium]|nr:lytic transglycosylase domain-containing protein [Thermoanaerobaculia bacterium]